MQKAAEIIFSPERVFPLLCSIDGLHIPCTCLSSARGSGGGGFCFGDRRRQLKPWLPAVETRICYLNSELRCPRRSTAGHGFSRQLTLEETPSISVFLRAGHCPVPREVVIPLERHGECSWIKEGTQESPCVRVVVRSPGDHAQWARGRRLLRVERWFEHAWVRVGFSAQQCPGFRCLNLRGASESGFESVTAPSAAPF